MHSFYTHFSALCMLGTIITTTTYSIPGQPEYPPYEYHAPSAPPYQPDHNTPQSPLPSQPTTDTEIIAEVINYLQKNLMTLTPEKTQELITYVSLRAQFNNLNQELLWLEILMQLCTTMNYHKTHLNSNFDMPILASSIMFGAGAGIFWCAMCMAFNIGDASGVAVSATGTMLFGCISLCLFLASRNPQHREKYTQYRLLCRAIVQQLYTVLHQPIDNAQ